MNHITNMSWKGWLPLLLLPPLAMMAAWCSPPWALMCALAFALFAGCKWLTWWDGRMAVERVPWARSFAYLLLWPGMDARSFLDGRLHPEKVAAGEWIFAGLKTLSGGMIVWGIARLVPSDQSVLRGWIGMLGLIFLLHFGAFHLLALVWQKAGVVAGPIMCFPLASNSLGEFWGRRWNRGFNDIVRRHVFQPLQPRLGVMAATMLTFLASGLVHDLVISVPAHGGYGLPTMYFLLQGGGVLFERTSFGKKAGLRHGPGGRLFTLTMTAVPAYWLFPPPFVQRVMVPFLEVISAL